MASPTKDTWHWFFPTELYLPDCVQQLLELVYPDVDWGKVTFHDGWPHFLGIRDKEGLTLPHSFIPGRIRVYFKEGAWDPCSCGGLGLIVHEGFHVLQIQNVLDGYGLGIANPTTVLYLACWANNGFSYDGHPAENAAYKVAGKPTSIFNSCCASLKGSLPCDCRCDPPTLDQTALDNFEAICPKVVQRSKTFLSYPVL